MRVHGLYGGVTPATLRTKHMTPFLLIGLALWTLLALVICFALCAAAHRPVPRARHNSKITALRNAPDRVHLLALK